MDRQEGHRRVAQADSEVRIPNSVHKALWVDRHVEVQAFLKMRKTKRAAYMGRLALGSLRNVFASMLWL
ncbi:hypothetical protein C3R74_03715 [Acidithiobacillus ferridurans]|nr:hypothetical protein C3R74_03715 [Acidithiobacillus ferridurans]